MKAKKKSKAALRREKLRREFVILSNIVRRHVSAAWNEAAEVWAKRHPDGTVRKFNDDYCGALLPEFNSRRDWSKAFTSKKQAKR